MLPVFDRVKQSVEKMAGCRIYRNSLPHGADFSFDIERKLGRDRIKVVFDVGANIGQSAIRYLEYFPQADIYSFEPVTATYQKLVAATQPFPKVHTYKLGMGREAGNSVINVSPLAVTSSIVVSRPEDHQEEIELETLSGFTERHHLETIDFLKVDTEGYDLEVLSGADSLLREQRIHLILAECEPTPRTKNFVSFSAMAEFMKSYDYHLFGVYEQQPEWDGRNVLLFWNALFACAKLLPAKSRIA